MKKEWRKDEKDIYLPKDKPEIINVPQFSYFCIRGKGNPNDDFFSKYIETLYSLSYAVKMSPKQGTAPKDYSEYTVYPLEGVWDIDEEAKKEYNGILDKNSLVFNLMIRQPDFVTDEFAEEIIRITKIKKENELLNHVEFKKINEGLCIQMMHNGSYDNEAESFRRMEIFTQEQNMKRVSRTHREIYLSDARKVEPDKLKTVLRFQVTK